MKLLIHDSNPAFACALIVSRYPDVEVVVSESYDSLVDTVRTTQPQVVLSSKFAGLPYPRAAIVEAPSVQWIHVCGTGVDHLLPWDATRVIVTNCSGLPATVMAEYALGAMLAHSLHLPAFLRDQRSRQWSPRPVTSLSGRTLLVVGLGPIGRAVAHLARAVGLRTTGYRSRPDPIAGFEAVYATGQLHEALADADFVVVTLPLTERTRGLIDAAAIDAMKPGAVLVNMARGGIVDEAALASALRSGRLGGAVIDVFATEPLTAASELWSLDNAVLTPHVAGAFEGWEQAATEVFADNFARWRERLPLINVVDPARGY